MVAVEGMVGLISVVALSGLTVGLGPFPQNTGNGERTVTKFVYERLISVDAFGYNFAELFLRNTDCLCWVPSQPYCLLYFC